MTASPSRREFQGHATTLLGVLRGLTLAAGSLVFALAAMLHLTWQQQAVLGLALVALCVGLNRRFDSYRVTLALVLLSTVATLRYGYWRTFTVYRSLGSSESFLNAFFILLLLLAEFYAFLTLLLGYLQTLWPLRRTPVPLPGNPALWPAVDLLITSSHEPLHVVKYTALAALQIDWPSDRLRVSILDDGRREDFRQFCMEAGIGYITPDTVRSPGDLNHALGQLHAPFVALFGADQVPTRSFLQLTMGWFTRDTKLAVLQTPQHSYTPDPFERNLRQFGTVPREDELFFGVVQDGNDFWNAATFCGSCAVVRRAALDEVGGFAVGTVGEDAQTSLRMQRRGWNTAYLNIPQAAGLATERLSGYVRERIEAAQATIVALRLENPLFAPGLSFPQRLCYFQALSQFLYALPRLVFLLAPLIFLFTGLMTIPGAWTAIAAFALPHLLLSSLVQSRIHGQHRHSFWSEIYETVLAPHLLVPTLSAFWHPRHPKQPTGDGSDPLARDARSFFDARIATPSLVLLSLHLVGILCALPRLFPFLPLSAAPGLLRSGSSALASLYSAPHVGVVWINVLWAAFNSIILGVATAVAHEGQQRRDAARVPITAQANVFLPSGKSVRGATSDLSSTGVMVRLAEPLPMSPGDRVDLLFPALGDNVRLPATVVSAAGTALRARFRPLTLPQEEALATLLYARADAWVEWGAAPKRERPLASLWRIAQLAVRGVLGAARSVLVTRRKSSTDALAPDTPGLAALILTVLVLSAFGASAQGGAPLTRSAATKQAAPTTSSFHTSFTLRGAHVSGPIVLRSTAASRSVHFEVPQSALVKTGTLRLRYTFAPGLASSAAHLILGLNGTLLTTVAAPPAAGDPAILTLSLPPELLVNSNDLRFELSGVACTPGTEAASWVRIDADSGIELTGDRLPLRPDLNLLPSPFLEDAQDPQPDISIVFPTPPSFKELQAAGIVSSWLGVLAGDRSPRFSVIFGAMPHGSAIIISDHPDQFPPGLQLDEVSGPTLAMRSNPGDTASRVLIVTGASGDDLVTAARVLALQYAALAGPTNRVSLEHPLGTRRPDDAPRWLSTDQPKRFGQLAATDLSSDGSTPVHVPLSLPPDLDLGDRDNLPLHLLYRYDGIPLAADSSLDISVNGVFVSSTPLPHTEGASPALGTTVPLPVMDLQPGLNTLDSAFHLRPATPCQGGVPGALRGSILGSSFLDLRGIPHWTALPNLALFARAGYPFTRMADLADTAVVLPENATPAVLELYLTLMARFGQDTGTPATAVSVTDVDGMSAAKDFLVLGSLDNLPARSRLGDRLPLQFVPDGVRVEEPSDPLSWLRRHLWPGANSSRDDPRVDIRGGLPDAVLEGIGWHGRSLVLVAVRDKDEVPRLLSAFTDTANIGQNVSVLRGSRFQSFRLGSEAYFVGTLSGWQQLARVFGAYPWLLVLVLTGVCFGMAAVLEPWMRQHARSRLQGRS